MSNRSPDARCARRKGAAVVELAILLPLLVFLCVIAVDFARIFYFSQTIANCARNGALWASDQYVRSESHYTSVEQAALADASNLMSDTSNLPTVSRSPDGLTDSEGKPYVEVTVTYKFTTITKYIGVPTTVNLVRTVRMANAPANPSS